MATTTNYSWTTPDDTDLVKDGASAIRTLGSAIDTTVFTNAGAAIQKSIVDAAGDLIYATADDTPARLAIGTAGQVLQVNSGATAPEWATTSTTFVGAEVAEDTNPQSISNNTHTSVTFTAEFIDTDGFHSNITNTSRITIPSGKDGIYRVFGQVTYNADGTGNRRASIAKNGTRFRQTINVASATASSFATAEGIFSLVAGDYVEVQAFQNSGGALDLDYSLGYCKLQVEFLGA